MSVGYFSSVSKGHIEGLWWKEFLIEDTVLKHFSLSVKTGK